MIPEPLWLSFLIDLITDESKHFLLALAMGSVGYWSTWTIWYVIFWRKRRLTRRRASTDVAFGIAISCWLVGLSFALASHWLLDYAALWYITPLGPGLDLIY